MNSDSQTIRIQWTPPPALLRARVWRSPSSRRYGEWSRDVRGRLELPGDVRNPYGGFQVVMGDPQNGWFLLGEIPSTNGWWLGVTPILGNPHIFSWAMLFFCKREVFCFFSTGTRTCFSWSFVFLRDKLSTPHVKTKQQRRRGEIKNYKEIDGW